MTKLLFSLLSLGMVAGVVSGSENDALLSAAQEGNQKATLAALNAGANPDQSDHVDRTPLYAAADGGHLALAELLIMRGADVNQADNAGYSPLLRATIMHHQAIARLLLQHKANVNVTAQIQICSSPLMLAAWQGDGDMVKLLLEHQANVDLKDGTGRTALDHAESGRLFLHHPDLSPLLRGALAKPEEKSRVIAGLLCLDKH